MMQATVVGAGLAGSEAAWQLAQRGVAVTLVEMKPQQRTPAHSADTFAELVWSTGGWMQFRRKGLWSSPPAR